MMSYSVKGAELNLPQCPVPTAKDDDVKDLIKGIALFDKQFFLVKKHGALSKTSQLD